MTTLVWNFHSTKTNSNATRIWESPGATKCTTFQSGFAVGRRRKRLRTTRRSRGGAARGGGTPCATSRASGSAACWRRTLFLYETKFISEREQDRTNYSKTYSWLHDSAEGRWDFHYGSTSTTTSCLHLYIRVQNPPEQKTRLQSKDWS